MDRYSVYPTNSLYNSLEKILTYKVEKSKTNTGAIAFREKIFTAIENLETFPLSGKKVPSGYAKIVNGHFLIYRVDTAKKVVYVVRVIDPTQDTNARKYL